MKNQDQKKEIWVGVEQLENDPNFLESIQKEFSDDISPLAKEEAMEVKSNRRDFLKFLGNLPCIKPSSIQVDLSSPKQNLEILLS